MFSEEEQKPSQCCREGTQGRRWDRPLLVVPHSLVVRRIELVLLLSDPLLNELLHLPHVPSRIVTSGKARARKRGRATWRPDLVLQRVCPLLGLPPALVDRGHLGDLTLEVCVLLPQTVELRLEHAGFRDLDGLVLRANGVQGQRQERLNSVTKPQRWTDDRSIEKRVRIGRLCEQLISAQEGRLGNLGPAGELVDLALIGLEERLDGFDFGVVGDLLEL